MSIVALMGVGVTALGIGGVVSIKDTVSQSTQGAVAVDLLARTFADDVQGSSGLTVECAPKAGGTHLITFAQSDPERSAVEYRIGKADGYTLVRTTCTPTTASAKAGASKAKGPDTRTVLEGLAVAPSVTCDDDECAPDTEPRAVVLSFVARDAAPYELEGVRRSSSVAAGEAPVPPPTGGGIWLLGDVTQLRMGGSATLTVQGDLLANAPAKGGEAVSLAGAVRLNVRDTFAIQAGGTCKGCDKLANKLPEQFDKAITDPRVDLPAPPTEGLEKRTDCPVQGKTRVCLPGIYPGTFPPAAGAVSDYRFEPGVYVLEGGMALGHGTFTGEGVLFYNPKSGISIGADAKVTVTPPERGDYAGILLHQPAGNTTPVMISGSAVMSAPAACLHAPGAELQMSGSAQLTVNEVVMRLLNLSGASRTTIGRP